MKLIFKAATVRAMISGEVIDSAVKSDTDKAGVTAFAKAPIILKLTVVKSRLLL